jgi:hypothetical protein
MIAFLLVSKASRRGKLQKGGPMYQRRAELHNEVVEALVSSKAINFEAIGTVLSKYGARAALTGEAIGVIINRHVMDLCIPVDFKDVLHGVHLEIAPTVGLK